MSVACATGSPVTGYKMLLQLVATQFPNIAASNLAKSATLRHSYQNRPAIGCSVMWALGLAGFKDLSKGLRGNSDNIIVPMLDAKNLSNDVHSVKLT